MTMRDLAQALHITHTQLQYYETGSNQLSASMLYNLATILGMPVEYFFEGWPPSENPDDSATRRTADDLGNEVLTTDRAGRSHREVRLLIQAFARIGDPKDRAALLDLVKRLARVE